MKKLSFNENYMLTPIAEEDDNFQPKKERMKKFINTAIKMDLTQRQRDCMIMYYFQKIPVSQIALQLNLHPQTIYKHLHCATQKLKKLSLYMSL